MPNSMTGFGQAKAKLKHRQLAVEIRSVNHRHLDFSVRLPASLNAFETELRELVRSKIKRGKVNAYLSWNGDTDQDLEINTERVERYIRSLRRLARTHKLDGALSVSDVAAFPNVFTTASDATKLKSEWPHMRRVIDRALTHLVAMRAREGARLAQDITRRLGGIRKALGMIQKKARLRPKEYREKLQKRIAELSGGFALDEKTLAKEVALFSDRADVTEEMVRLDHHLTFFKKTLAERGEVGKRLDFISQEILRETNTIASKASSYPIAREVVAIKAEVEKIREQVQNIE